MIRIVLMDAGIARRYRPARFSEVVEQQTTVRALKNALENNRIGHAYLFYGPRGTGKTTIARLLAKRINCFEPVDNEACDKCESCVSIREGRSLDVIEIDAASNRKIDDIRELRENVRFQPMVSIKKVYIIDEVHMLTTESFNALLKTLEEPPDHVIFVLATTEINKIPETILSRCQVFTFKKVPLSVLAAYLGNICQKEGITANQDALFLIARKGDGSVRDSLSFLEQAMSYCGDQITTAQVRELSGDFPIDLFLSLTAVLQNPDSSPDQVAKPVIKIFEDGGDLQRFIWEYLDFLRRSLYILRGNQDSDFLGIPGSEIEKIRSALQGSDKQKLTTVFHSVYGLLSRAHFLKLRNSYESRVLVELELVDLHEKLSRPSISGIIQKLNHLSTQLSESGENTTSQDEPLPAPGSPDTENEKPKSSPETILQEKLLGTMVDPDSVPHLDPRQSNE